MADSDWGKVLLQLTRIADALDRLAPPPLDAPGMLEAVAQDLKVTTPAAPAVTDDDLLAQTDAEYARIAEIEQESWRSLGRAPTPEEVCARLDQE